MTAVIYRTKTDRPFVFKSLPDASGQYGKHAIIECFVCGATAQFPYRDNPANMEFVAKRFERGGWELYKAKARCPTCRHARTKQKAHFAKLNEEAEAMPEVRSTPQPNGAHHPQTQAEAPVERIYLLTITADGQADIRPLEAAQTMLFGDREYFVVPK